MPETQDNASVLLKLRRLWKGTLYVGIVGLYGSLLLWLLIYRGWRPFLLALLLLGLAQLFRHIATDVDRLGWMMDNQPESEAQGSARQYQSRMFLLLFFLIQLCNIAIVMQVYTLTNLNGALVTATGFIAAGLMFRQIRGVNQIIAYERASYGIKDAGPLTTGPRSQRPLTEKKAQAAQKSSPQEMDEKLAVLQKMAAEGLISESAYITVRDRELVKRVMEETPPTNRA